VFNAYVGYTHVYAHSSQDLSIEPSINEHPHYWHSQKKEDEAEETAEEEGEEKV
jgi:hypothetical protein